MKVQHSLFSQVALAQDLPEHGLKRGDIATIVEHYPMPKGEEDGYSLEGFDVPHVTLEVAASQIIPIAQWQQEEMTSDSLINVADRYIDLEDVKENIKKPNQGSLEARPTQQSNNP